MRFLGTVRTLARAGALCACLLPAAAAARSELFPRPPELEPAVAFWIRVYTEIDTRHGFLHDARDLSVVYARLPNDRPRIDAERRRIREDLRALAGGGRADLSPGRRAVLALWPEDVSGETLRAAVSNVRWQLGQSDRFRAGLRRSGAYREHIARVIVEKGLPPELAVLPHVESSFNPKAYSSASAAGMWQFGRATGRRFMDIDHVVDQRMDPYIATYAAMELLKFNHSALGTWPLALTAYNHGAGGIARAVAQTGTKDIEKIVANYRGRLFGFASRNFYAQFLAVLELERNLERYFGDVAMNPAPRFHQVKTDAFIDAEVFARHIGVSLEQLRADNPALLPPVWEGDKRIPADFTLKVREDAAAPGDLLALVPEDYKFDRQVPDVSHTVRRGDTMSAIAERFGVDLRRLVALNRNRAPNPHRIRIGQELLLPQEGADARRPAAGESGEGLYTVGRDDTIPRIAARHDLDEEDLLSINDIADPHQIYPGQRIRLRGPERPDPHAAPPEPAVAAREEESLPPGAVLPDNQRLETPVTPEEERTAALDPQVDVAELNEELRDALAADPSDYGVAADRSIEIHAEETLGHYAEWLDIRAWDLRRLNGMAYRDQLYVGERLRLDFSRVDAGTFELRRRGHHAALQEDFFGRYRIRGATRYRVRSGDTIGRIEQDRGVPRWLLRQYNPELQPDSIRPGQEISIPVVREADG